jgi:hypothetical protein
MEYECVGSAVKLRIPRFIDTCAGIPASTLPPHDFGR